MNKNFLPNKEEKILLPIIQKYLRQDFALIRMTKTMLNKGIIDASFEIRDILKSANIVDYESLDKNQDNKIVSTVLYLENGVFKILNVSYYRPKTKNGDPRFWIYGLSKLILSDDLIYFTTYENQLLAIPLTYQQKSLTEALANKFGQVSTGEKILIELIDKLKAIVNKGWVESVRPTKAAAAKDAGETLEALLGISPNNLVSADYKGEIEIKTKISKSTSNTLFCSVPEWGISEVKSSTEMILKYGYQSRRYQDFIDLYVTVNNKPNNQGLFLVTDDEISQVIQNHDSKSIITNTCRWQYKALKEILHKKHPKTVWIVAEKKQFDGRTYFKYNEIELTQDPIFSQFLLLIQQGEITFDWRGRVDNEGKNYKDKGHAFRIKPRSKSLLFGSMSQVLLT